MEVISGRIAIQEFAADHAIHPIHVSQWKKRFLEGASELFTCGRMNKETAEGKTKETELFQQIGRLQMELVREVRPIRSRSLASPSPGR